jgi:methylmalonyl-CoA mutase
VEYLRAGLAAGLDVDRFAPRLSFFWAIGMNFFMEVAKLRAARFLWAELIQPFEPKKADSLSLRTHCQTSGVSLTALDPYNNVIRTTIEAMAAVLGGTQSLHTNAFDEALGLPTDFSARIARNTQLVIQEETGVPHVSDPLGGSYYIEALTTALADQARELIAEVDRMGGAVAAVEQGWVQDQIEQAAFAHHRRVQSGEEVIVGVNRYTEGSGEQIELHTIDPEAERRQVERTRAVRARRDAAAVELALAEVGRVAGGEDNLLPAMREALRVEATVGEVCDVLRGSWGTYDAHGPHG